MLVVVTFESTTGIPLHPLVPILDCEYQDNTYSRTEPSIRTALVAHHHPKFMLAKCTVF